MKSVDSYKTKKKVEAIMKIPFIFAISGCGLSGVPNLIDGVEYFPPGSIKGVNYQTMRIGGNKYLVHPLLSGVSLDKRPTPADSYWDVFMLLPEDASFDKSTGDFRLFRRGVLVRAEGKNKEEDEFEIMGPMSLKAFELRFPELVDDRLRLEDGTLRCPHIFAGDPSPTDIAKCSYEPTDVDCRDDMKAVFDKVVTEKLSAVPARDVVLER